MTESKFMYVGLLSSTPRWSKYTSNWGKFDCNICFSFTYRTPEKESTIAPSTCWSVNSHQTWPGRDCRRTPLRWVSLQRGSTTSRHFSQTHCSICWRLTSHWEIPSSEDREELYWTGMTNIIGYYCAVSIFLQMMCSSLVQLEEQSIYMARVRREIPTGVIHVCHWITASIKLFIS